MIPVDHYMKLETETRRASAWSTSSELPHPDECPQLVIRSAKWVIRPRGLSWRPLIADDGSVTMKVLGDDAWAGAEDVIAAVPVRDIQVCETCGQPTESVIEVDADQPETLKWLVSVVSFVSKQLDVYYHLSTDQKADLLSFDVGRLPEWVEDVLTLLSQIEILSTMFLVTSRFRRS